MSSNLMTAIKFAAKKHHSQLRKDSYTPFIVHPLVVAITTAKLTKKEDNLIAAVLHDVIEDTKTSFEEIENMFGSKVSNLVKELTHDLTPNISKDVRKLKSIEKIKHLSKPAALIKYCDILCNNQELLIQLKEEGASFIKSFNWSMREKYEYEVRRLEEFKKNHKNIDTKELEICLEKIKVVIS